jgi:hypothetical protein
MEVRVADRYAVANQAIVAYRYLGAGDQRDIVTKPVSIPD